MIVIIGGGPAGLAAAEAASEHAATRGIAADVHVFDAKPSFGRKFLLAGKSGLNLSHAEDPAALLGRFGTAAETLAPALDALPAEAIRAWASSLGIETFVGSSGRIFPVVMKASPLLRAWLERLRTMGVSFHPRHRWVGWRDGSLVFETPAGPREVAASATVLALGGGSWPRLGSDGAWMPILEQAGVGLHPLRPANCGFDVDWTPHLRERFAGTPVKSVELTLGGRRTRGDFIVTATGIEGSAVYALAADLRDAIEAHGAAILSLDLAPDRALPDLIAALARPRGKASMANLLRKTAGLTGVKAALLREPGDREAFDDPTRLATRIKALPLTVVRPRPLPEAISSAGGVALRGLDEHFMLTRMPGVFAAGEMLDWEAPTGGYLLTACFATGRAAGRGAAEWVAGVPPREAPA
jgi:uncharacterized flavoprotein (TIGR03862 family)